MANKTSIINQQEAYTEEIEGDEEWTMWSDRWPSFLCSGKPMVNFFSIHH
jgi:hypothetical protein